MVRLTAAQVDLLAIAELSHTGNSNFAVKILDGSGSSIDLLVNTIGSYRGTRLIDESGTDAALVEITADGAWAMTISSIALATIGQSSNTGSGDEVIVFPEADTSPVKIGDFTCSLCESNIAVHAYTATGRDLLINDIGSYTGQVIVPEGTFLIAIQADGQWSLSMS